MKVQQMKKNTIKQKKSQRGMVLAMTMFVLVAMTTIALLGLIANGGSPANQNQGQGGLASHINESQLFGKRRAQLYVAQAFAEDGIRMAMQWLNQNRQPPQNDTAFAPSETTQANCTNFMGSTANGHWNTLTITNPDGTSGNVMVRMYPFKQNDTSGRKQFIIESVGTVNGVKQVVRATAVQQTFAKYAFFADKILANPLGEYSLQFTSEANAFKGPVHINGMLPDGSAVNSSAVIKIRWQTATGAKPTTTTQIFRYNGPNSFTTALADTQIQWLDMNGTVAPVSGWNNVIATNAAPKTGSAPTLIKPIRLPVSTTTQKDAATNGVTPNYAGLPEMRAEGMVNGTELKKGGIYVNGNVSNVVLKATGTNATTQIIEITQNWDGAGNVLPWKTTATDYTERRATITIDRMANTTMILNEKRTKTAGVFDTWTNSAATQSCTGTSNGVIYFEGNIGDTATKIGGLSGAIANNVMVSNAISKDNSLMIVTDQTKTVQINGGIIFANAQDAAKGGGTPSNPTGSLGSSLKDPVMVSGTDTCISGLLGIVTKNVLITQTDVAGGNFSYTVGGNAYVDLSIHAIVMAYETIEADGWSTRPPGTCRLIGGFISAGAKPMGAVSTQTTGGVTTVNVANGFNVDRNYDARGASSPPPFYPAPAGVSFLMTSMQRVVMPLDGVMP
jgi:hypothetical protein